MATVPAALLDLLATKVSFAHLATTMANGAPQVTPVWFSFDGSHLLLNSAKGRLKDRNMRARPAVAVSILDPENPYRYLQLMGQIVDVTEAGGDAHIDALAKKYLGQDTYPGRAPGEVRVIYRMALDKVQTMG